MMRSGWPPLGHATRGVGGMSTCIPLSELTTDVEGVTLRCGGGHTDVPLKYACTESGQTAKPTTQGMLVTAWIGSALCCAAQWLPYRPAEYYYLAKPTLYGHQQPAGFVC